MNFAIYDTSTGRIIMNCDGNAESAALTVEDGQDFTKVDSGVTSRTHYINVDTGNANQRDTTPCTPSAVEIEANGIDTLTLSQMRANTVVTLDGPVSFQFTTSTDNAAQPLTFDIPGTYRVRAKAPFPALVKEFQIDVSNS